ncbi:hypothetical protein [Hymenobacter siberiensis]|uniref:hypothetical protein n=1 Tax=Hymenobacter siberiensis TaxID=2848396 RepID=UPI001C1DF006|nr:hypothetical protein [Hymenobacter siberiensis]
MLAYAALDGFCDALYYSRMGADAFSWNEHLTLTAQRVVFVLCGLLATQVSMYQFAIVGLAWGLGFSLVHNGFYEVGRQLIDGRKLDYTYRSSTSTAKWDFTFKQGLWMAIVGIAVLIASIFFRTF